MQSHVLRFLAGFVVLIALAGPALAVDYEDDFQDDTPPNPPSDDWYTFATSGTGSVRVSNALTSISTNTLLVDDTSAGTAILATFDMSTVGVDVCESGGFGASLKFAIYFVDFGGAGQSSIGFVSDNGIDIGFIRFSSAGAVSLIAGGSAGSGFATLSLATWYNITLNVLDTTGTTCANTDTIFATGYVTELDASGQLSGTVGGAFATNVGETLRITNDNIANIATYYLDNLQVNNVNEPPPTAVGALATVAVTNLVGFDVDSTGTGLIARIDGGDDIQAYAPNTLTPLGAQRNVDCNGVGNQNEDMVAATDIGLVYIVCDSGSNNPAFFSIRSLSDGQLTFDDPDCDPDEFDSECLDDIDLRGGSDCADGDDDFPDDLDLRELGDIASVPLDYSYITNNEFGFNADRAVAFAYSADNGFIGVMQYTAVAGFIDDRCRTTRANFAGSQAEQIAVWQPNIDSEVVYFAAVDTGSQSKLYHYTPLDDACGGQCLQGTLVEAGSVGGTSGGTAVSCDDFYCLVATTSASDNLRLINLASGATVWSKTVGEVDRGVALSVRGGLGDNPDGDADDFAVYLDGSSLTSYTANIVWASNGTAFGSIAAPTGTFVDLRLKDDGSLAWIATDDIIAVYDIRAAFPDIIPTGCENPPCDEPGDEPGDGSVLFPVSGLVDSGTFPNAGLANMFMGVLMVAGMTVTLGFSPQVVTKGRAEFNSRLFLVLGVIGAILGFVLAIAFGLFSTAVWVSVVVLAAIAVGVRIWLRSRGE